MGTHPKKPSSEALSDRDAADLHQRLEELYDRFPVDAVKEAVLGEKAPPTRRQLPRKGAPGRPGLDQAAMTTWVQTLAVLIGTAVPSKTGLSQARLADRVERLETYYILWEGLPESFEDPFPPPVNNPKLVRITASVAEKLLRTEKQTPGDYGNTLLVGLCCWLEVYNPEFSPLGKKEFQAAVKQNASDSRHPNEAFFPVGRRMLFLVPRTKNHDFKLLQKGLTIFLGEGH